MPEFGTVTTEDGFRDLLAMSSYARLQPGVAYPAALLTTGFNDPRVDSWDPGKMAARLQAINAGPGGSGKPVLLRVDFASGHGAGTTTSSSTSTRTSSGSCSGKRRRPTSRCRPRASPPD